MGKFFINDDLESFDEKNDTLVLKFERHHRGTQELTRENKVPLRLFRSFKYINNSIKVENE